jgi:hypothetical protein
MRVLDGNVLAGTDHRLKPLRQWLNACLPGKSLVVYEPAWGLVSDLVLCEDAYAQERALVKDILPRVQAQDLWVADRNFATLRFAFGVARRHACFVVREHSQSLPWRAVSKLRARGQTETGTLHEQHVVVTDPDTRESLRLRRIELHLFEKTRDGDSQIVLLTNLSDDVAAACIATIYRQRWTIETHFQFLTMSLHCEVPSLSKPRAALLMFAMALVAGNALAVVRASLRQAHGMEAEATVSGYYLADEVAFDYRTLMKYLPPEKWAGWRPLAAKPMVRLLTTIATGVNIGALTKSHRGPKKKPAVKPKFDKKNKHRSTARLLREAKDTC